MLGSSRLGAPAKLAPGLSRSNWDNEDPRTSHKALEAIVIGEVGVEAGVTEPPVKISGRLSEELEVNEPRPSASPRSLELARRLIEAPLFSSSSETEKKASI